MTVNSPPPTAGPHENEKAVYASEDHGLQKGMGNRQLQMIAIGSAIGTGLLLGTGSRLQDAGPFLSVLYLVCGFFGYIILRSLGELIVYRPSSGSFVSYAREFYGEKTAFVTGWLYWGNWAMTLVADGTAVAIYIKWFSQYTSWLDAVPQWLLALVVICGILVFNMLSVKIFGELEYWFSLIKIVALIIFMLVAIGVLIFGHPSGDPTGFSLISDTGGWLPNGLMPAVIVVQGVVFAYAGIELVGTTSGETKNVEKHIPRAVNNVLLRILIFYFGSVLLLTLVLPYTDYVADVSPFAVVGLEVVHHSGNDVFYAFALNPARHILYIYELNCVVHKSSFLFLWVKVCLRCGREAGGWQVLGLPLFRDGANAVAPCVPHCHKDRNEEQGRCKCKSADWIIKGHQDNNQTNKDEHCPVSAFAKRRAVSRSGVASALGQAHKLEV